MPAAVRKRLNADTASAFSTPCVALAPPPLSYKQPGRRRLQGVYSDEKVES
jgi:hypothetical protein